MDNDTLDTIVIGGPSYFAIDVAVTGRSAHAGMEPEKGINAIHAAAKAIAALPLGRLDHETTANVGVINGGIIRNGVPASCSFLAECRSRRPRQGGGARRGDDGDDPRRGRGGGREGRDHRRREVPRGAHPRERAGRCGSPSARCATIGIDAKAVFITGFTDASIYNNHGIEMAVVGIGAQNEHSTEECVAVADMEKAVKVLLEILRITAQ